VAVNGDETVTAGELALFERAGEQVVLEARTDSIVLAMGGQPIDEPIVGYGPFVMNTRAEINQAMADFQAGHF
jgi:redox-sensitive bicupin YhaK (pirin superfamily)